MGLPPGLLRVIVALCSECRSLLLFGVVVVGEIVVTGGVKQGCPMSGRLFAMAMDPFLRRLLSRSIVDLMRLTAYADDIALVLANLWADAPGILEEFVAWSWASGLELNAGKCVLVPLWAFVQSEVERRASEESPQSASPVQRVRCLAASLPGPVC